MKLLCTLLNNGVFEPMSRALVLFVFLQYDILCVLCAACPRPFELDHRGPRGTFGTAHVASTVRENRVSYFLSMHGNFVLVCYLAHFSGDALKRRVHVKITQ